MRYDRQDSETAARSCIGVIALLPALMVYGAFINAYVVVKLWAWFVVPTFGLPALTLPVAAGLSVLGEAFRGYKPAPDKKENEGKGAWEKLGAALVQQTVFIGLALLFGYVIKTWWLA